MAKMTAQQSEQYYRVRLDPYKVRHDRGMGYRAMCPMHGGRNPTQLWVDIAEGNYSCCSCGAKGGSAYTFEQAFLTAQGQAPNHDDVMRSLAEVLGTPFLERTYPEPLHPGKSKGWNRKQAQDYYRYTDELAEELFTVWRFVDRTGRKQTPADRPCPCRDNPDAECALGCADGRVWTTKGVRRVLYRLPDVFNSSIVFVVEGEKNANDLSRALAGYIKAHDGFALGSLIVDRVAVTTNPGGASAWKKEYGFGQYFFGKVVIKLGDNDGAGRLHDQQACEDIAPHALKLFILALPVGEEKDISDFLAEHTIDDLLRLLPSRVEWKLPKRHEPVIKDTLQERTLLVKPSELAAADAHLGTDWLVDGLIERGTRGLVVAPPKTGKSLLFLDMALSLATGNSFLGLRPYSRPVKCAVISREDGPTIVHRRLSQLAAGRGLSMQDVDKALVVNTENQSSTFKIDVQKDLEEMAVWLKREEVEFVVIDVLNRLHSKQENSSDDMTFVMQKFDELGRLGGCQVCVIAHTNKLGDVKGSTSIAGWPDYIVRLEQHPDDQEVKTLLLKTKLSGTVPPRTIRYWQSTDQTQSRSRAFSLWRSGERLCCINSEVWLVGATMVHVQRRRFPVEIILFCVRWYCKYGISYRDVAEMIEERGVEVDPMRALLPNCPISQIAGRWRQYQPRTRLPRALRTPCTYPTFTPTAVARATPSDRFEGRHFSCALHTLISALYSRWGFCLTE